MVGAVIPFLKKIGHRKSWLIFTQILIFFSIILASYSNPQDNLKFMAITVVLLAFFSATQDIVIDAFRIESAPQFLQGPLSSMYIAGYRVAMLARTEERLRKFENELPGSKGYVCDVSNLKHLESICKLIKT